MADASDWELVDDDTKNKPQAQAQAGNSDWELLEEPKSESNKNEESLGASISMAPLRVLNDIGQGLYSVGSKVPQYYQNAKTEIPNMIQDVKNQPMHAIGQALSGLAQHGKSVFNAPHDFANYLTNRLHLLPEETNKYIQMGRMPEDTQNAINQTFGQPSQPGDAGLQWMGRNVGNLATVPSIVRGTANTLRTIGQAASRSVNPRVVAQSIQASHDTLSHAATDLFDHVGQEVVDRNVPPVTLRPNLIAEIANHSLLQPNSRKTIELLNNAHSGDYQSLRDLNSDLWTRATKAAGSDLAENRNAAETLFDLRDEVNNSIRDHFNATGNPDLAAHLDVARDYYRNLRQTYFSENVPNAIKQLVDPNIRRMPNNILNELSDESIPMARVLHENPIAQRSLTRHINQQSARSNLLRVGKYLGLGAVSGAIASTPAMYQAVRNVLTPQGEH